MVKKALFISKFYQIFKDKGYKTIDDFFNNSKEIYEEMIKDEDIGLKGTSYRDFMNGAQAGFGKAQAEIHMSQFMGGFRM